MPTSREFTIHIEGIVEAKGVRYWAKTEKSLGKIV